jgi:hypothetical protein
MKLTIAVIIILIGLISIPSRMRKETLSNPILSFNKHTTLNFKQEIPAS